MEHMDAPEGDDLCTLIGSTRKLFVEVADGLSQITAEQVAQNESTAELLPILLHELCPADMVQVVKTVQVHRERLPR